MDKYGRQNKFGITGRGTTNDGGSRNDCYNLCDMMFTGCSGGNSDFGGCECDCCHFVPNPPSDPWNPGGSWDGGGQCFCQGCHTDLQSCQYNCWYNQSEYWQSPGGGAGRVIEFGGSHSPETAPGGFRRGGRIRKRRRR